MGVPQKRWLVYGKCHRWMMTGGTRILTGAERREIIIHNYYGSFPHSLRLASESLRDAQKLIRC